MVKIIRPTDIQNETYRKAVEEMVEVLNELNIPKRRSKKAFEEAKNRIEEIAEKYDVKCDVDYWLNNPNETPKSGFQILNMYFDDRINHLNYKKGEWRIYSIRGLFS